MPRLWLDAICPYCQRIEILARDRALDVEFEEVDLRCVPQAIRSQSPSGKVPVLEDAQGWLFESQAILEFLETQRGAGPPADPWSTALRRAWCLEADRHQAALGRVLRATDPHEARAGWRAARQALDAVLPRVLPRAFARGRLTLPGIAFAPILTLIEAWPGLTRPSTPQIEHLLSVPAVRAIRQHSRHQRLWELFGAGRPWLFDGL